MEFGKRGFHPAKSEIATSILGYYIPVACRTTFRSTHDQSVVHVCHREDHRHSYSSPKYLVSLVEEDKRSAEAPTTLLTLDSHHGPQSQGRLRSFTTL